MIIRPPKLLYLTKNLGLVWFIYKIVLNNLKYLQETDSMSFYRSQPLDHYKLILPRENAWQIMNMLGQLDMIHIVPSTNPILQKPFTSQIRRCQQCLQKIYNLQQVLHQNHLYKPKQEFTQRQLVSILQMIGQKHLQLQKQRSMSILDQLDEEVEMFWNSYQSNKRRAEMLEQKMMFYRENIAMIRGGEQAFGIKSLGAGQGQNRLREEPSFGSIDKRVGVQYSQIFQNQQGLTIKCGILQTRQQPRFSRTIFRMTRGNCYIKFIPFNQIIPNPTQKQQHKTIYFLLFPAKTDSYLQRKINKFISNYNQPMVIGEQYKFPSNPKEYVSVLKELTDQYNQAQHLLGLVQKEQLGFYYHRLLGLSEGEDAEELQPHARIANEFYKIQMIKIYLLKQLEIFSQLNEMDLFNNFLQAEIFLQPSKVMLLQNRLTEFEKQTRQPSGHLIPIEEEKPKKKPTLYLKNEFTRSAQDIVETYGVAQYRQANPALFTAVTFPFLFGVMFGDIGHGILLFAFGLYLVTNHVQIKRSSSPLAILVPHRYLFAMMGFFATFCGFIYNDFLSMNLNLFGSCFDVTAAEEGGVIARKEDCVYGFGVDPVWGVAENNLNYINSLKMKISVIIGVVHMTLGVLIKATNSLYFKRKVEFWFEFIPQLLFLVLVFGYMDFLIIFKWLKDWGFDNPHAPSIITSMINLPLQGGHTDKECCHGGEPMWGTVTETSQDGLQKLILAVAFISIPVMLLVKPLYTINRMKKQHKKGRPARQSSDELEQNFEQKMFQEEHHQGQEIEMAMMQNLKNHSYISSKASTKSNGSSGDSESLDNDHSSGDHQHQPSQIFVHQMIETIEFVLGCISNTASYLRLWALSLAHSQLADVFLDKALVGSLEQGYSGIFGMLVAFPLFAAATFGVLMCMDVMECFLHTLRLHWVEFQNKFYKGDGFAFCSYNFLNKINQELAVERIVEVEKLSKVGGKRK